jgi:hypothetical protein
VGCTLPLPEATVARQSRIVAAWDKASQFPRQNMLQIENDSHPTLKMNLILQMGQLSSAGCHAVARSHHLGDF